MHDFSYPRLVSLIVVFVAASGCVLSPRVPSLRSITALRPPVKIVMTKDLSRGVRGARVGPVEVAGMVSTDDRLFVATAGGVLYCLNLDSWQLIWRKRLAGSGTATPLVSDRLLVVGDGNGIVYGLDAKNGKEKWRYEQDDVVVAQPVAAGGQIYLMTSGDKLVSLRADNGTWLWEYERKGRGSMTIRGAASPAIEGGHLIAAFSDGAIVGLELATGKLLWVTTTATNRPFTDVDTTPLIVDGLAIVAAADRALFAIDLRDGSIRWRYDHGGISAPVVVDKQLLYLSSDSVLSSLNPSTGQVIWSKTLAVDKNSFFSQPASIGKYLFVVAGDGTIIGLSVDDPTTVWQQKPGQISTGVIAPPHIAGGRLLVLSNAGKLYIFSGATEL